MLRARYIRQIITISIRNYSRATSNQRVLLLELQLCGRFFPRKVDESYSFVAVNVSNYFSSIVNADYGAIQSRNGAT